MKYAIGLAGLALLVGCGSAETFPLEIPDSTAEVGSFDSSGALDSSSGENDGGIDSSPDTNDRVDGSSDAETDGGSDGSVESEASADAPDDVSADSDPCRITLNTCSCTSPTETHATVDLCNAAYFADLAAWEMTCGTPSSACGATCTSVALMCLASCSQQYNLLCDGTCSPSHEGWCGNRHGCDDGLKSCMDACECANNKCVEGCQSSDR
jgi:hypothetical protein